jgi:hypothetical protein
MMPSLNLGTWSVHVGRWFAWRRVYLHDWHWTPLVLGRRRP